MDYKDTLRHWLFAIGATIVYMAASGVGIFLWAFFFLPVLTGRIATPEESLAWWFGLYFITMCAIMGYIWHQELSLDPELRRVGLVYIALPGLSFLVWCSTTGELVICALALIMMWAFAEAHKARRQTWELCSR